MATYVNDLRLKEIGTGESSGTWGTETNTNLELIGEALGFGTEAITTNADTHTTTVADGSTDPGRAMYIKYTGTLDSACTITIAPNTMSRMHFIENGTSGSQNIIISQGTGANVTIPAGDVKAVYLDGAGSGAAVTDAFASLNVVDLKVEDDLTVTDDLIVNGDIDLEGSIDVNGTANLDVVDIDGAVDMASTLQVDGSITSSDGATITVNDNSIALSLISTDADANEGPGMVLYRNSSSPADNDALGQIYLQGENDADQKVTYSLIEGFIDDASDGTEDGILRFSSMVSGTSRNRMDIIPSETVFNQDSVDVDFRVESNGNTNMLFVDAGNDLVTVGGATFETADTFCVREAGANSVNTRLVNTNDDANGVKLILQKDSSSPADNDELGEIAFLGQDDGGNANTFAAIRVFADDVSNASEDGIMTFSTAKAGSFTEHMRIQPTGRMGIGVTDPNTELEIGSAQPNIRLRDTDNNNYARIGGSAGDLILEADGGNGGSLSKMSFRVDNADRMELDANGSLELGHGGAAHQRADSQAFSIITPASGGGQGIALKRLDTNTDQGLGEITWSNNTADGLGKMKGKTDGATNSLAITFETASSGTVAERMRMTSGGSLLVGLTSAVNSEILGVYSNDGHGLTVGTAGTNTYRTYRHVPSSGIHTFASSSNTASLSNAGAWTNASDRAYKKDIVDTQYGLDTILNLQPRDFTLKVDESSDTGFIAQEVETVLPQFVIGEEGNKNVNYAQITAVLTKAIQEQQEQIEQLKTEIKTLQ